MLTKNEDFERLVLAKEFPPRAVALQNAQVPMKALAEFLLARLPQLEALPGEQTKLGMLQLRLPNWLAFIGNSLGYLSQLPSEPECLGRLQSGDAG